MNLLRNLFSYKKLLYNNFFLINQTVRHLNALRINKINFQNNETNTVNCYRFEKINGIQLNQLRYKSKNRYGKDKNVLFQTNFN
jgi:hypothetical protein